MAKNTAFTAGYLDGVSSRKTPPLTVAEQLNYYTTRINATPAGVISLGLLALGLPADFIRGSIKYPGPGAAWVEQPKAVKALAQYAKGYEAGLARRKVNESDDEGMTLEQLRAMR